MARGKLPGPNVWGVATNDADYVVNTYEFETVDGRRRCKLVSVCPFYRTWHSMLRRCYSDWYLSRNPTYVGCEVDEEWLTFSKFKAWMEKQDWEGKQLDKDILGNGKLYSQHTCCFISRKVNGFLNTHKRRGRKLPTGVHLHKRTGKYVAQIHIESGAQVPLGIFDNPQLAHEAWFEEKLNQCKLLIESENLSDNVAEALFTKTLELKDGVLWNEERI